MPRKLKVYGWSTVYVQGLPKEQFNLSFRVIVAASSQKEAARIVGKERPGQLWNLSETGNVKEIEVAMAKPGAVFARIDRWHDTPYTEVENPVGRF